MPRAKSNFFLGNEFDSFLFAYVGEDMNGLPISVVSLLGRLNLDPWLEAASFADLSSTAAAKKLASLIAALPGRPSQEPDPVTLATRLIGLLPRRKDFSAQPIATPPSAAVSAIDRRRKMGVIVIVVCIGLLMAFSAWA
jgi:hypothetical protein